MKEQYNDEYGERTAHNLHSSGRVVLNIWRAMQTELKLPIYNREACCAAVLRTRVPEVPYHVLAGTPPPATLHLPHVMSRAATPWQWHVVSRCLARSLCLVLSSLPHAQVLQRSLQRVHVRNAGLCSSSQHRFCPLHSAGHAQSFQLSPWLGCVCWQCRGGGECAGWFKGASRWRAVRHVRRQARLNVAMLDQLDLINRTAELAKTFGIDFYSVISRGSQYRVESMLARLAHTQNHLLVRPLPGNLQSTWPLTTASVAPGSLCLRLLSAASTTPLLGSCLQSGTARRAARPQPRLPLHMHTGAAACGVHH